MGFPFIPVLAVGGLATLGYLAFRKKPVAYQPGQGGTSFELPDQYGQYHIPSPAGGAGTANSPTMTIPGTGGIPINIELPTGISSDVYQVMNAPNMLLVRSAPVIDGHAPGQGNVVGALPNGTIVKKVPGTEIGKNKTGDNPGGFMNIQTLDGTVGWAAVDFLGKASIGMTA